MVCEAITETPYLEGVSTTEILVKLQLGGLRNIINFLRNRREYPMNSMVYVVLISMECVPS